jgi:hypothetical protein
MTTLPTSVLPKRIPHGPHKALSAIQVSPLLLEAAGSEPEEVMQKLHTSKGGLSGEEAERRLTEYGPNVVAREAQSPDRLASKRRRSRPTFSPPRCRSGWPGAGEVPRAGATGRGEG